MKNSIIDSIELGHFLLLSGVLNIALSMMLSKFRVFRWEKGTAFKEDIRPFFMRTKRGNPKKMIGVIEGNRLRQQLEAES
ncbi:hypothetical protein SBDP1_650022 [Syntrophobacter sp. SbD1]|nr:hypothetical protein SBDP1_650022 [Syntrophobacter sp. SbD1]